MVKESKVIGDLGEILAENYLKKKKYRVLERNYRSPFGEIDIVAVDPDGTMVFVEVRTRNKNTYYRPEESVGKHKARKIVKTSLFYLQEKGLLDKVNVRYDIIGISGGILNHIKGAFEP